MPENPIHLVIGTPCYGGLVTSTYFSCIMKLKEASRHEGMALTLLMPDGDDLIQRSRQEMAADFMGIWGATHLLFIDNDMGFEPDQVFRLLRFGAEVVAGACPLKHIDWEKVRTAARAGWENLESAGLRYVVEAVKPPQVRDGFVRVHFAGSGFLLIKRSAFAALMERHPELRYSRAKAGPGGGSWAYAFFNCKIDGKDGPYLSEDYSFCRLWTGMGGEIWVDLNSRIQHVGQAVFAGDINSGPPPVPPEGGGA